MENLIEYKEKLESFDLYKEDRNELNLIAGRVFWLAKEDLNSRDLKEDIREKKYDLLFAFGEEIRPVRDHLINYEAFEMADHVRERIIEFLEEYMK